MLSSSNYESLVADLVATDVIRHKKVFFRRRYMIDSAVRGRKTIAPESGHNLKDMDENPHLYDKMESDREENIVKKVLMFRFGDLFKEIVGNPVADKED